MCQLPFWAAGHMLVTTCYRCLAAFSASAYRFATATTLLNTLEVELPTVKLRDGDITLYTRGDSANWYAGFRLPDGGRLQESLKTRNRLSA